MALPAYLDSSAMRAWPIILVKALPELLLTFLKPKSAQSLERLQLVQLDIIREGILLAGARFENVEVLVEQPFLTLKADVFDETASKKLQVTLRYFLRGQRKYYRRELMKTSKDPKHHFRCSLDDIEHFFTALMRTTDYFYNRDLLRLNGQTTPLIPAYVLIAIALCEAVNLEDHAQKILNHYSLSFQRMITVDEPLVMASGWSDSRAHVELLAGDELAVVLEGC